MTNAEMAKKIKELEEKLYRYYDEHETLFRIRDEETEKLTKELNDKLDADDYRIKQLYTKLGGIERRLDSMDDATMYVRQVAEDSKKIEGALKVSARKLELIGQQNIQLREDIRAANKMCDSVSKKASALADRVQKLEADSSRTLRLEDRVEQLDLTFKNLKVAITGTYGIPEKAKTMESMCPCIWNCEHKGKESNGQAQECPIAEHFSYCEKEWHNKKQEEKKNIIFSEFNAGKRAIIFSDSGNLEKDYLEFWREFDKWCHTSEKEDKMYPQSSRVTRCYRMDPLIKCSSIYEDRSSFAIWTEHHEEEEDHTFEYGTLPTTWKALNTIKGLPYTEWSV